MEHITFRIEPKIKIAIEKSAEKLRQSKSDVVRGLAAIGCELQRCGGVKITGPVGVPRPFTKIKVNVGSTVMTCQIPPELKEELVKMFGGEGSAALTQAVRIAYAYLQPQYVEAVGFLLGIPRPLAEITFPKIKSRKINEYAEKLKKALQEVEKK